MEETSLLFQKFELVMNHSKGVVILGRKKCGKLAAVPTFQCACADDCACALVTGRVSGEEQRCLSSGVLQRNVQHRVEVLSVFPQTRSHILEKHSTYH